MTEATVAQHAVNGHVSGDHNGHLNGYVTNEKTNADAAGPASVKTTLLDPPASGYFGNLNESQQSALDTFRQQVVERFGPIGEDTWYDETTVLRFLRARKFQVDRAMQQFSTTDAWRKENKVDESYRKARAVDLGFSRRHYTRALGRRDKYGRWIYIYRPGSLTAERQKEVASLTDEQQMQRIVCLTEDLTSMWNPLATWMLEQEHPIDESSLDKAQIEHARHIRVVGEVTSIIDLDGTSLGLLWKVRNLLGRASTLNSAHFPETLGKTAIVNAPSFFSTIWGWASKWFDEGTRNKMFVVSAQELKDGRLLELVHKEDLPRIYGGTLDWRFEDEPSVDEDLARVLGRDQCFVGPSQWKGDGEYILFDEEERKQFPKARVPGSA